MKLIPFLLLLSLLIFQSFSLLITEEEHCTIFNPNVEGYFSNLTEITQSFRACDSFLFTSTAIHACTKNNNNGSIQVFNEEGGLVFQQAISFLNETDCTLQWLWYYVEEPFLLQQGNLYTLKYTANFSLVGYSQFSEDGFLQNTQEGISSSIAIRLQNPQHYLAKRLQQEEDPWYGGGGGPSPYYPPLVPEPPYYAPIDPPYYPPVAPYVPPYVPPYHAPIVDCGYCGDGRCQSECGELPGQCCDDCGGCGPICEGLYCGDGSCNSECGEYPGQCCSDCGGCGPVCGGCGDFQCQPECGETAFTCCQDCGVCVPVCDGFCGDFQCQSECGEDGYSCCQDCGGCGPVCGGCGDFQCQPECGETAGSCCQDCGVCVPVCDGFCGDFQCQSECGEDGYSCCQDCGVCCGSCGDFLCQPECGETAGSCCHDCGGCGPVCGGCGDFQCQPECGEDAGSCCQDCGSYCGDGYCQINCGEDTGSCCQDCGGYCGDGYCQINCGENSGSCCQDCGICCGGCGDFQCQPECGEDAGSCCQDCGSYCGDGYCQSNCGEDTGSCCQDCGGYCGDGYCQANCGENSGSCCQDCGICCGGCGDFQCQSECGEDAGSCCQDCGSYCGDGYCQINCGETAGSCCQDCGGYCGDGYCQSDCGENSGSCCQDCGICCGGCGDFQCQPECGEDAGSCCQDCGSYCGDGYCQSDCGENAGSCCQDCGGYCGDGYCQSNCGENAGSCCQDCGGYCGDGYCQINCGENSGSCCQDCGICCGGCGDFQCQPECGEDAGSCCQDCGSYCGDGYCQSNCGETAGSCCQDCGGYCGDGYCQSDCGEDAGSCCQDCGICCGGCGDFQCQPECGEDGYSCCQDCGSYCGDGYCQINCGENSGSCCQDCGICCGGCGDFQCQPECGEDTGSCCQDCGSYCGDGYCQANCGEDTGSCCQDCGGYCGDGYCQINCGENSGSCCQDCGSYCGDGYCQINCGEDTGSCCQDCGGYCGDGYCQSDCGENSDSCCQDCGICCGGCGDFQCQPECGEDAGSCCQDCGSYCGDGYCQSNCGENTGSCCQDCGGYCGDGYCQANCGETSGSCCQDCGICCGGCGDFQCQPECGEDGYSCCQDCGGYCGDGYCQSDCGENSGSCCQDCANLMNDPSNCGSCGHQCDINEKCQSGSCICKDGFSNCGAGCVDINYDSNNCGLCGKSCGLNAYCWDGYCYCDSNYHDCDSNPGCESDGYTDPNNCGYCGNYCSLNQECVSGSCQCLPGYHDCNGDTICESYFSTDTANCGGCYNACPQGYICNNGNCECPYGTTPCGGKCVDINTDVNNCGGCFTVCSSFQGDIICSGGECSVSSCTPGFEDCNHNPVDGCETPLTTSSNCGGCGIPCNLVGGTSDCSSGSCQLTGCYAPYGNCDGYGGNGCETPLTTNSNCGYCSNSCSFPQGNADCSSLSCTLVGCTGGWGNCDGYDGNGCESLLNTLNYCGSCSNNCFHSNAYSDCSSFTCNLQSCYSGFGDCDGYTGNGCETSLTTTSNCNGCGIVCSHPNAFSDCSTKTCQFSSCFSSWENCDGNILNGCETPLTTNSNCGGCGTTCGYTNAITDCSSGSCVFQSCSSPFLDCNSNLGLDGCETNGNTDDNHCGNCATVCIGAEQCVSGSCIVNPCAGGSADCDTNGSCETDINNDVNNCGGCGHVCSSNHGTASCSAGICSIICNSGFDNCNADITDGCETDLHTLSNCGTCSSICSLLNAASTDCSSGTCQISSCAPGWDNCDGLRPNGCETPLNTLSDCNACGISCFHTQGTSDCSTGTCSLSSCNGGFGNCDSNIPNGCESPLNTNSNCNGCGFVCSHANGASDCSSGSCQLGVCNGGWGNCDNDAPNGCEAQLNTLSNCAACGTVCSHSNAASDCSSGTCILSTCNGNFGDCDSNPTNGCEASLTTLTNCGTCGTPCSLTNAVSTCASGTCQILSCNSGWDNCDGIASNGCERPITTLSDCGACDAICSLPNIISSSCLTGTCKVSSCSASWGNCDSIDSNGCETPLNTNSDCVSCGTSCSLSNALSSCTSGSCQLISCNGGFGNCDLDPSNGCEVPLNTLSNCASCATTCPQVNSVSSCSTGTCQVTSCNSGWDNCDGIASNGCESPLNTLSNCGVCGTACSHVAGASDCSSGTCLLTSCNSGFGNCDANPSNGCETPLNSLVNCGVCGTTCGYTNAITDCSSGSCVFQSCSSPFLDCNSNLGLDGCETNGNTDDNHCGNCATVCIGAEQCVSGSCIVNPCAGGSADCDTNGSCETDINNDVNNCGGCGHVCSSNHGTASCSAGICSIICNSGFDNCNADITDGCETDLHTLSNCGTCSSICSLLNAASTDCSSGTCQISSCTAGWDNCDGLRPNGCETPLNTLSDCGGCGTPCTLAQGTSDCSTGTCSLSSCNSGFGNCDSNPSNGCETSLNTLANCGVCGTACSLNNAISSCSSGTCQITSCNSGWQDCDLITSNGCETPLNTNSNCGSCGILCNLAQGTSDCSSGTCLLTSCNGGFGNCDSNPSNGCESPLNTLSNCITCGTVCSLTNAVSSCSSGSCQLSSCNSGWENCDSNPSNGCETPLNSLSNCGGCGTTCNLAQGISDCSSGTCTLGSCNSGFGNCDSNPSNGCEAPLNTLTNCGVCGTPCSLTNAVSTCASGTCQILSCNSGWKDCDGIASNGCERPITTLSDCGTCGTTCSHTNGASDCSSGTCLLTLCNGGFGNCDANPSNGCETPLNSLVNCGVCGTTCGYTNAITDCSSGSCVFQSCSSPFLDCNSNLGLDGCETNGNTDDNHCGNCATVCIGAEQCVSGSCIVNPCAGGSADCDTNGSCETDINNDVNNCGGCGHVCSSNHGTASCSAGICSIICNSGFDNCNADITDGCETDLHTLSNCGSCASTCSHAQGASDCSTGACTLSSCYGGFDNCDSNPSNGCETPLNSLSNCGGCGTPCNLVQGASDCSSGTCLLTLCNGGFGNCDGNPSNGCETPLNTLSNCGVCGTACSLNNAVSSCSSGTCQILSCNSGWKDCDGIASNGCERPITTLSDCGTCDAICSHTNGASDCSSGTCLLTLCNGGFGNCDSNPSNGCETPLKSLSNCGVCGTTCGYTNAITDCSSGSCVFQSCSSPFLDCNSNLGLDGCETNGNTDDNHCGNCATVCIGAEQCVSGSCIVNPCAGGSADCDTNGSCETDINNDVNNCGGCGHVCSSNHGTASCSAGICSIICNSGFGNCNADITDGCETDLHTLSNCGTCSSICSLPNAVTDCSLGICQISSCNGGWGNCDINPTNGCEKPLTTLNDCGSCGTSCSRSNGVATCTTGNCQLFSCNPGFGDCDLDQFTGCETSLNTLTDCSSCGTTCSFSNGVGSCSSGSCQLSSCSMGYSDCNGSPVDGCEINLQTNSNNCGGCGTVCSSTGGVPSCSVGICSISCILPSLDCNANPIDGCEVNSNIDNNHCGNCATVCIGAEQCVSGSCIVNPCAGGSADCDTNGSCETDINNDVNNCGGCGHVCSSNHGTASCSAGICSIICNSGFDNCNADITDGCETDLHTLSNCGTCSSACTLTNAVTDCSSGTCSFSSCNGGWGNCDSNPSNGCETSLNSLSNCASCGTPCSYPNAITSCASGSCLFQSCSFPFKDCNSNIGLDGCETNSNVDQANCGNCGNICVGGEQCISGSCIVTPCTGGTADCDINGSCETDILTDNNNCGGCGNNCILSGAISQCIGGACEIASCNLGLDDCNSNPADGCETSLFTLSDCGACNTICSLPGAVGSCTSGVCLVSSCTGSNSNCNSIDSDGCEVNLSNSMSNCGACNNPCTLPNANSICSGGICLVSSCNTGFGDCTIGAGCETSLTTTSDCGTCGNACSLPNATPACISSTCQISSCNSGFGDCDLNAANGCEVSLSTTINHCGSCATNCNIQVLNASPTCSAGVCGYTTCNTGFLDCDGDPTNGCETVRSISNCASCGNSCSVSNGQPSCVSGSCTVLSCNAPFSDCDGLYSTGCEVNRNTDTSNCGGCLLACNLVNSVSTCSAGTCQISSCNSGFGDCDLNTANGCEVSLSTTINHCGSCATNCNTQVLNASPTCTAGVCGYTTCNTGFLDCDGDPTNGCETARSISNCASCGNSCSVSNGQPSCVSGSCTVLSCNAPFSDCDGLYSTGCEVNRNTDTSNCGVCGSNCGANSVCTGGVCTCSVPFGDCDGNPANGCEVNFALDGSHCGNCATVCSVPFNQCSGGTCIFTGCAANTGDCDANQSCESNLLTDPLHCGGCAINCGVNSGCVNGGCVCNSNFADCDALTTLGCEVDTTTSTTNCGGCGRVCNLPNSTPICVASSCVVGSCAPGFANCDSSNINGCEINVKIDSNNCDSCGNVCPANTFCSNGACVCASNFADCNGLVSDGCEADFFSTINCGGCGVNCNFQNSNPICNAGSCSLSCLGNFRDCDLNITSGCETDVSSNVTHCNACNSPCNLPNSNAICVAGVCKIATCISGFFDCDGIASNGCEVNLKNDPTNCGSCSQVCSSVNGAPTCVSGVCSPNCNANFGDCDGNTLNGCETNTGSSTTNCGNCGVNCGSNTVCANGACSCVSNFFDCDSTLLNGCEINTLSDSNNCGGCGKVCSLGQSSSTCTNGICVIRTCNNGFGDCDGVASNGCEANLLTTQNNCGQCGIVCPLNTVCNNGACICSSGFADCDSSVINGCETDITSVDNCGSCSNQCSSLNGNSVCFLGSCRLSTCVGSFFDCDGSTTNGCEVNLSSDNLNCGTCGKTCNPNSVCTNGACNCLTGFSNCDGLPGNGCEADLAIDTNNCGTCGTTCFLPGSKSICSSGVCVIASCSAGKGDCDAMASNGCEADLTNSPTNCGSCGNVCPNNTVCTSGKCACVSGYEDCDGISSNGCEANLSTSNDNCGFCKNVCPQDRSCSKGTCTCPSNFADCDGNPANGCESNLLLDIQNCGNCNSPCIESSTTTTFCFSGSCTSTPCESDRANCDLKSATGCEVQLNTNSNCASCGDKCEFPNSLSSCENSQCIILSCTQGFEDADHITSNGCESKINLAPPDEYLPSTAPVPSIAASSTPSPSIAISKNNLDNIDTNTNNNGSPIPTNNSPPGIPITENTVVQSHEIDFSTAQTTTSSSTTNTAPVVPIAIPSTPGGNSSQPTGVIQVPVNVVTNSEQVTFVIATTDITSGGSSNSGNTGGSTASSDFGFAAADLNSAVVTILLYDSAGNEVHQLDAPITICLSINDPNAKVDQMCLAYEKFECGKSKWVCESDLTEDSTLFCGDTSHLTNFALLLQGNGSKNGDEPVDLTFSYISLAFIIAAIIICLVSSIVYDIRKRYLSYSSDRSLKESFARHESRSKGNSQSGTYINV